MAPRLMTVMASLALAVSGAAGAQNPAPAGARPPPGAAARPPACPRVAAPTEPGGSRIVGGYQAVGGTVPFQVELMAVQVDPTLAPPQNMNYRAADLVCRPALPLQCGGVLIAPGWALTAAHCVDERLWPQAARRLDVMTGSQVLSRPGPIHPVRRIIVHDDYVPGGVDHDIALVRFDPAATARPPAPLESADRPRLAPIALSGVVRAQAAEAPPGRTPLHVSVTGWGRAFATTAALGAPLGSGGRVVTPADLAMDALQEADLVVVAPDVCQKQIDGTSLKGVILTPRMFCAASADSAQPRDSCSGDSGGPVFHKEHGRWILDGLVSFGDNDQCGKVAGVYTRVDQYADWIRGNMGPDAALLQR